MTGTGGFSDVKSKTKMITFKPKVTEIDISFIQRNTLRKVLEKGITSYIDPISKVIY